MQSQINQAIGYDEIDIHNIFRVIKEARKMLFAITGMFALVSLVIVLMLPNKYTADLVLAPTDSENGGLSGALSQLDGFASLAGVSLGVGENFDTKIAREIMQSWQFVEDFIEENNLQVKVYAASSWNEEDNRLVIDDDIYDEEGGQWKLEGDNNQLREPTSWELYLQFSDMLTITSDDTSGFITLSVEYYSPHIAKELVDLYFKSINKHMQNRKLNKVNINIDYLQAQIEKTPLTEMHEVFYTIIEEQLKVKMIAEATPEHTFVVVSPSMIAEKKSSPMPLVILFIGTIAGLLISIVVIFLLDFQRQREANAVEISQA